jgi:hypothetical protein
MRLLLGLIVAVVLPILSWTTPTSETTQQRAERERLKEHVKGTMGRRDGPAVTALSEKWSVTLA